MFIEVTDEEQIDIVESLAREIWTEHYTPIIGRDQVDYMLAKFQSGQTISEQIKNSVLYFLIETEAKFIGYLAVQPRGDELFLSKIYIKVSSRGRGFGRKTVEFTEALAKEQGLRRIVLTVNRNNTASIRMYEKTGFRNVGSVVQDIGGGFVMDDYVMEKTLDVLRHSSTHITSVKNS